MAKKKKVNPYGSQTNWSNNWSGDGTNWTPPTATFVATLRLGDNGYNNAIPELLLGGDSQLCVWGKDANGDVDSNVNFQGGIDVTLTIPQSSVPETATLQAGSISVDYTLNGNYNNIMYVVIQAYTSIPASPLPTGTIKVQWESLNVNFVDANGVPSSNPDVPAQYLPVAQQAPSVKKHQGRVLSGGNSMVWEVVTCQPESDFAPVRVNVQGLLTMTSTDPTFTSYPTLSSTALKAMIWAVTDVDEGLTRRKPKKR